MVGAPPVRAAGRAAQVSDRRLRAGLSTRAVPPGQEDRSVEATESTLLVTVTGPDKPGVSSAVFAALTGHGVSLLDVEQVVIRGQLILGVLVVSPDDPQRLRAELARTADEIDMTVQVSAGVDRVTGHTVPTHAVVVLGRPVTAAAFTAIAGAIAGCGANIDSIRGLADYPVTGLELQVTA